MGGCCCCADSSELNASPQFFHHPVSEKHLPLSPHHAPVSTGLLVDTNLDTSVPDTYRPPPAPIPDESCEENPTTPSGNREGSVNKSEVALETSNRESIEEDNAGSTLDTKVKKPLSPHHAPVSTDLLVDTNLDTSVPDTYRPPPSPIPYESCEENPTTPSGNREGFVNKSEVALETSKRESDENVEKNVELERPKLLEEEKSDGLKKSVVPPLQDEKCPICLEEYDVENPKIITKCDHHFHLACILEWMERSETCPVCDQE